MNKRMHALRQRRGELLARIETQRVQVAGLGSRLEKPLALADRGLAALRFLQGHPLLTGGAVALVVLRRRGLTGLIRQSWLLWKGYRYFVAARQRLMG